MFSGQYSRTAGWTSSPFILAAWSPGSLLSGRGSVFVETFGLVSFADDSFSRFPKQKAKVILDWTLGIGGLKEPLHPIVSLLGAIANAMAPGMGAEYEGHLVETVLSQTGFLLDEHL